MTNRFLKAFLLCLSIFIMFPLAAQADDEKCLFSHYETWHVIWTSQPQATSFKSLWAKVNNHDGFYGLTSNGDEANMIITKKADGTFEGKAIATSKASCTFNGTIVDNKAKGTYSCDTKDYGTIEAVIELS